MDGCPPTYQVQRANLGADYDHPRLIPRGRFAVRGIIIHSKCVDVAIRIRTEQVHEIRKIYLITNSTHMLIRIPVLVKVYSMNKGGSTFDVLTEIVALSKV